VSAGVLDQTGEFVDERCGAVGGVHAEHFALELLPDELLCFGVDWWVTFVHMRRYILQLIIFRADD
jgi:hypothetical protein